MAVTVAWCASVHPGTSPLLVSCMLVHPHRSFSLPRPRFRGRAPPCRRGRACVSSSHNNSTVVHPPPPRAAAVPLLRCARPPLHTGRHKHKCSATSYPLLVDAGRGGAWSGALSSPRTSPHQLPRTLRLRCVLLSPAPLPSAAAIACTSCHTPSYTCALCARRDPTTTPCPGGVPHAPLTRLDVHPTLPPISC